MILYNRADKQDKVALTCLSSSPYRYFYLYCPATSPEILDLLAPLDHLHHRPQPPLERRYVATKTNLTF